MNLEFCDSGHSFCLTILSVFQIEPLATSSLVQVAVEAIETLRHSVVATVDPGIRGFAVGNYQVGDGIRVFGGRLISHVDVITTSPLVEVQIDILITIIGELLDTVLPTAACCSGYL